MRSEDRNALKARHQNFLESKEAAELAFKTMSANERQILSTIRTKIAQGVKISPTEQDTYDRLILNAKDAGLNPPPAMQFEQDMATGRPMSERGPRAAPAPAPAQGAGMPDLNTYTGERPPQEIPPPGQRWQHNNQTPRRWRLIPIVPQQLVQ